MAHSSIHNLGDILAALRTSPEALPWRERRALAKELAAVIAAGEHSDLAMQLVDVLAADPKWEVRADVADLLLLLPEDHFTRLAAGLSEDTNSFVRSATERALDRRRRGQQMVRRTRQGLDQVQSQYATLERLHGKQAAERSREIAERLFDHLVGSTVHEMRGILTPLKATASTLLHHLDDGAVDPLEFRRQLTKFADRLAFLERLLEDMRSYSQPLPLERRSERLSDLVIEATTMAREHLEACGRNPESVAMTMDVPTTITIEVSRHQILVAFANVLKNAFDAFAEGLYTFSQGEIKVVARCLDEEKVELTICDNGMGICPEDLQDLREFVPGKTTKKNLGTGFGLPIAKRNIKAHGGSIGIDSQEEVGTTITIVLPIAQNGADDV